ncbi:MAG: PKD domain-containing protein [Cyclobacteriaceae bacterium]
MINLGNIQSLFNQPASIQVFKRNGVWYGLVHNWADKNIVLLTFGNSLSNTPSAEEWVTNIGAGNSFLEVAVTPDSVIAIVTNANATLSIVNLPDDFVDKPIASDRFQSGTLSGFSTLMDLELINVCGEWFGFAASLNNKKILRLSFGSSVFKEPASVEEVAGNVFGNNKPTSIQLVREAENYIMLVNTIGGSLYRAILGNDILATIDNTTVDQIGSGFGVGYDLSFLKDKGEWYGYVINDKKGELFQIRFPQECSASIGYSIESEPSNIRYNQSGMHHVFVETVNENGSASVGLDSVEVLESQSPEIDFSYDNQCASVSTEFEGLTESSVLSYNWIINGDARTGEITTYDFPAPGTYEVTLEVESENGCGQRVTQEITIYDPPNPNFSLPSGQICTNGAVSLTNLTNTQGADDIITYQWFVDDELVSEVENPDIVFAEGGNKTLRLDASIPGCTETYETTVNVAQGPTVAFTLPPQLCAGEVITLENQTSGDNITGYQWSFGDGGTLETTSAETITYTFPESGIYDISLTANTSLGCANVMSQTVTVFEQPTVGFSSDVACVGAITQFTDTTTAGNNANIVAWQWDFGDGVGTSDIRNPNYTFTNPGTYTVELTTQSSGGCAASATQTITVETSVTPGFTATRVCPNSTDPILYQFADTSTVADGDQITQWLWTINGENFVEESVTYAFTEPGTYDVSLTTFASSGCNATISQSLVVNKLPVVQFEAASGCVGEALMLRNETQLNGWDLKQYMWQVPTVGSVFEQSPSVVFSEAGEYPITLTVETADGCTFSFDSTLTILESPVAAFDVPQLSGGAPLIVNTTNLSSGYTQSLWEINGEVVSEENAPVFTLDALGTYEIALIVQNAIGCADTTRKIIEVVNPTLDIVLEELTVVEGAAQPGQLVLLVRNQGTLAVDAINVLVTLGDVVSLNEQIEGPLLPGERLSYPLQTSLSAVRNQQHPVDYICISATIDTVKSEMAEVSLDNNRVCITLNAPLLVEAPFPNPAREAVALSILLEAPGEIRVKLISATGELMSSQLISEAHQGLNSFSLDVSQTPSGVYTVEVSALGQKVVRRIIVNP